MAANSAVSLNESRLVPAVRSFEVIVQTTGWITSATSGALERRLCDLIPRSRRVVLDISKVDYIDSSGFAVLAGAYAQARRAGCELEITNPKPSLRQLSRMWLHSVFEGHTEMLGVTPD
jgi:anti-anti-sigma factor